MEPATTTTTADSEIEKQYAQYKNVLKGAKEGEVCTRFPPEPSGYLHIGHVKAAILNYHYAKIYKGKMLLRFDDTNPNKEKDEYVQSIIDDLATLKIVPDKVSYTSDHFDKIEEYMAKAIKDGKAYCDDTPVEQMRKERGEGIESKNRNKTPEENLKIWQDILAGKAKEWCVRGKINMQDKNKCMRDPVFYRCSDVAHHRVGRKYKAYPTYDWACAIVDSIEGVTHALRTNEYADRNAMYDWVLKVTGLRKVTIYDFSRLNLVNTTLSKRKLTWFVDTKRAESWEDPRFPTVRGIMRRGLVVEALTEFMLGQGPSKNTNLQEWDKIWATNKKYIDPLAGRYTAISKEKTCTLKLNNKAPGLESVTVPLHQKNAALGTRPLFKNNEIYIEYDDAKDLKVDEKITLMNWGNCFIRAVHTEGENILLEGELAESDTEYKSTKKLNWLPKSDILANVSLLEFDHLINVKKVEDDMNFEDILTENSRFSTQAYADPNIKNLTKGTIIQFERRGYYIVDRVNKTGDYDRDIELIYIPDGKAKAMSSITTKVDVGKLAKGSTEGEVPEESLKQKERKAKKERDAAKKAKEDEKKAEQHVAGDKSHEAAKDKVADAEEKKEEHAVSDNKTPDEPLITK